MAARRTSGLAVKKHEQSRGVKSHLWALTTSESARSTPSSAQRNSGQIAAEPAYAASTCSHTPLTKQSSPISGSGSTDVVEVVPTVATTAHTSPFSSSTARRSGRIRKASSVGSRRSSSSSKRQAFATEECVSSVQTTARRPLPASRAAASALSVEADAEPSI